VTDHDIWVNELWAQLDDAHPDTELRIVLESQAPAGSELQLRDVCLEDGRINVKVAPA
jgi:hypothetical protein